MIFQSHRRFGVVVSLCLITALESIAAQDPDDLRTTLLREPRTTGSDSSEIAAAGVFPNSNIRLSTEQAEADLSAILRPMTSIRLNNAAATSSGSGEFLNTPDDTAAELLRRHGVEHHFTAEPWHRSHPPRNTFPLRHQPLYFEDPNLERCGQSWGCLTELTSVIHFGARIPALPYLMASDCPQDRVRALPDCPECHRFSAAAVWPKPTLKAASLQAAATVGLVFLIP